jgi:hypothetical protein
MCVCVCVCVCLYVRMYICTCVNILFDCACVYRGKGGTKWLYLPVSSAVAVRLSI